jgi:hypothetical protein
VLLARWTRSSLWQGGVFFSGRTLRTVHPCPALNFSWRVAVASQPWPIFGDMLHIVITMRQQFGPRKAGVRVWVDGRVQAEWCCPCWLPLLSTLLIFRRPRRRRQRRRSIAGRAVISAPKLAEPGARAIKRPNPEELRGERSRAISISVAASLVARSDAITRPALGCSASRTIYRG